MQLSLDSKSKDKVSTTFLGELFYGFSAPVRALQMIVFHPKLLTLSIMPVMITLVVFAAAIYGAMAGGGLLISTYITNYLGQYAGVAVQGIFLLLLIFFAFQTMIYVVSFLAIPFNDFLAEATEKACGIEAPKRSGFGYYARVMTMDVAKAILNLAMTVACTIGTWLPVAGIVFFLGLAFLNTLNFISYPQSRRLQGVPASFLWVKQNGPRSLGFGAATLILFSIPVVNFFALPLCVVGGTLIYIKK